MWIKALSNISFQDHFLLYLMLKSVWICNIYRQPNKVIVQLTFPKWLVLVCTIHMLLWMLQTETSHLWKVRYAIILLGWRYGWLCGTVITEYLHSCFNLAVDKIHLCAILLFESNGCIKVLCSYIRLRNLCSCSVKEPTIENLCVYMN